jgi:hypothetical protein
MFEDEQALSFIRSTDDPIKHKRTKIKGYNEKQWAGASQTIMRSGLYLKFSQNHHLKNLLLSTGTKYLGEASPYDSDWGTGISLRDSNCFNRNSWGRNMLGILLMETRESLKS